MIDKIYHAEICSDAKACQIVCASDPAFGMWIQSSDKDRDRMLAVEVAKYLAVLFALAVVALTIIACYYFRG